MVGGGEGGLNPGVRWGGRVQPWGLGVGWEGSTRGVGGGVGGFNPGARWGGRVQPGGVGGGVGGFNPGVRWGTPPCIFNRFEK